MKEPPKIPIKILRWFCSEERIEELEGDLYEVYQEYCENAPKTAALKYWMMVLNSFRFYALKNSKQQKINQMNHFIMLLKHNLIVIFRQLLRNKTTTAISIAGLVIGLTGVLSIYSLIRYEFSFNNHIPDGERIYGLYTKYEKGYNQGISTGMAEFLQKSPHQDVEYVSQIIFGYLNASPDNGKKEKFTDIRPVMADGNYFKVFSQYDWLAGNPESALEAPFRVVLSKSQAEKYFKYLPADEVMGKTIAYDDSLKAVVTGIVDQQEGNSDFLFTDFISISTVDKSWLKERTPMNDWESSHSMSRTWVKTKKPVVSGNPPDYLKPLNSHLDDLHNDKHGSKRIILAKPLSKLHFDDYLGVSSYSGRYAVDVDNLYILSLVCCVLLLMALFNFINLEIAQGTSKAKEVGIKKVLGSNKAAIFLKFIMQSQIILTIALVFALPLAQSCIIYFKDYFPERMQENLFGLHYLLLSLGIVIIVGCIAGLYPAIRVSGIKTVKALKSNSKMSFSEKGIPALRKILVSFQFITSQILIIGSLCVYAQIQYIDNKDMGFNSANVMYFWLPWQDIEKQNKLLYSSLEEISGIDELTRQSGVPATHFNSTGQIKFMKEGKEISVEVYSKFSDTTYLDFYNLKLLAGRNYKAVSEPREIMINETLLKQLGFSDPNEAIGETINRMNIVGVVEDFHMMSLKNKIKPLYIAYSNAGNQIAFKTSQENTSRVIEEVTTMFREVYPNSSLKINFLEEEIAGFYEEERKISSLTLIATILAVIIAGLGLFGLISISLIQRTKEVGIRKVLGAGVWSLSSVIAREFIWLILIAFFISAPIAFLLVQDWLTNFVYHASPGWWVYLLGGVISLIMAVIATGVKIYQAVASDPVESLRYE